MKKIKKGVIDNKIRENIVFPGDITRLENIR